ncbi:MAG: CoA transferase subunit A [Dehalococcoidia bacterium]|jgi:3-oxoacid CoA-transferase A subunit|nr:CoA transferase subunit A [Dehalococcoidia bacterium]
MPRPRIFTSMDEAIADFPDNSSLMIPGFGPGQPINLMAALWRQGATGITSISNGVGFAAGAEELRGLGDLVMAGRVKKVIAAFTASTRPSRAGTAEELIRSGAVQAELAPQGTLAERIRAGGAGIPAFFTPAGVGTETAIGKEHRDFDGRTFVMEHALFADFAFIRAWKADTAGNLIYRRAARNFNPIMAMAARTTIVEVEQPIVEAGTLDPDQIHTPGIYVHRLIQIPEGGVLHVDRATARAILQVRYHDPVPEGQE